MFKKLLDKKIKYNILSLVNISIAFLFTVLLGKEFGVGSQTDMYFYSLVIINFLGYFIQAVWEGVSPNYIKLKVHNHEQSVKLYSILLNNIIVGATIIIVLFYMLTGLDFFDLHEELKNYLNIFIFYLLFQNILYFNKTILNLEHFYASYYLVDLFIYSTASLYLLMFNVENIFLIAYLMIMTTAIAVLWQFYLIFIKLDFKYFFNFYEGWLIEIYKNSIKYKAGTMIYNVKDIIIVSFFTSLGEGSYSLYSYADKFASTVATIVNAPIVNIFITKVNYLIAYKHYHKIDHLIKNVLFQTLTLFLIASTLVYLLLPSLLKLFFNEAVSESDIGIIVNIFIYLLLFYFIIILESPYAKANIAFKLFNYMIYLNALFLLVFYMGFLIHQTYTIDYEVFLLILSAAQFSNLLLYYYKYRSIQRKNLKEGKIE